MFKGEPGIQGASEARNITRRWEAGGDRFALNLRKKLPRTDGSLQVTVRAPARWHWRWDLGRWLGSDEVMNRNINDNTGGHLECPILLYPLPPYSSYWAQEGVLIKICLTAD